jgi:hypothetical protein
LRRDSLAMVEQAPASAGRTAAALGVLLGVSVVAVVPAALAWRGAGGAMAPLAAGLGGLALVLVGLKLALAAGGLLAQLLDRPWLRAGSASID